MVTRGSLVVHFARKDDERIAICDSSIAEAEGFEFTRLSHLVTCPACRKELDEIFHGLMMPVSEILAAMGYKFTQVT